MNDKCQLTYSQIERDDGSTREWRLRFANDTAVDRFHMLTHLPYYVGFEPNESGVLLISHDYDAQKSCVRVPGKDAWAKALEFTRGATGENEGASNWRIAHNYKLMRAFGFPDPKKWDGMCRIIYTGAGIVRLKMLGVDMPLPEPPLVQSGLWGI